MTTSRPGRGGPRQRQPTEVRRRLILDAVVELVTERGVRSTGIRDIAAAAGVSVGTVTYHFAGVREILAEAVSVELDAYYTPLLARAAALPAAQGLTLLLDAALDEATHRHWRLWFECWQAGVWDDDFVGAQSDRYGAWHEALRSLLQRATAEGSLRCDDPDGTAARLVALIDGLALHRLRGVPPLDSAQATAQLHAALRDWTGPA